MKKILTGLSITVFILVIAFAAFAQKPDKKDNKKEQHQGGNKNQDKQRGNDNNNKGNNGNDNKGNKDKGRGNDDKRNDKGNNDKDNGKGNNGNKDDRSDDNGKGKDKDRVKPTEYAWNRENFKDRKQLRKGEKVTICHKFNSNNEPGVTLNISSNALKAHMAHGDVTGSCPTVNDGRYSDIFLRRRTDYYNDLVNSQEQVIYSRSILDYALDRLTNSRSQLVILRNNNAPVVEIQRREAVIVELERNVSLLEAALGVAANLVAQKLRD